MPIFGDILEFLACQALGKTSLPVNTGDLSKKTIIVTGANSGLGLDACKHLAAMGVGCLVLACRDISKGMQAKEAISDHMGPKGRTLMLIWKVDLDDHESVRSFTNRVRTSGELKRVDAVIANAGIELQQFEVSEELERSLNVNVVSTYLLCLGILPALSRTAQSCGVQTTLTLVGSLIHYFGPDAQLHSVPAGQNVFKGLSEKSTAKMQGRYPLSKLAEHLCFNELITHFSDPAVTINLVNPGWCGTGLGRHRDLNLFERTCFAMIGPNSEEGSRTLVHGVLAGRETHGKYLSECQAKRQSTYVNSAKGRAMSARLWADLMPLLEAGADKPTPWSPLIDMKRRS